MVEKIALASCNGMSPNGLVSRVAVGVCKKENENIISICMGSTSADIEGKNNPMLKKEIKYPDRTIQTSFYLSTCKYCGRH